MAVQRFETRALNRPGEYSTTELFLAPGVGVIYSGGLQCASRTCLCGFQEDALFCEAGCFSGGDDRVLSHGCL